MSLSPKRHSNTNSQNEPNKDYDVYEFARILEKLQAHMPISDRFDSVCGQEKGVWYYSQQEHMVNWFIDQNSKGSGAYTRDKPNRSAKTTYNRLLCPGALLWIAEALGEEDVIVQSAANAARVESDKRRRCGIIRTRIPWERIMELADNHPGHSY